MMSVVGSRIVVGMSGGVDSSVAAALLVERGHEVIGVTMRVWGNADAPARFGACCGSEAVDDARRVARALGIPYYVLNMEHEFERAVIDRFAEAYRGGRTPVPCVACNVDLKFGSLLARAHAWGASGVATGHYARVTRDETTGRYLLWRGKDAGKDQSDFLWPLSQRQLAAAHFPIGDMEKSSVRDYARRVGLVTAEKPESQEICFIPDNDYRGFLRRRDPSLFEPGPLVDKAGAVVGTHAGVAAYTIGQRKGLGSTGGSARYVVDIDARANRVRVGDVADLERDRLLATSTNFIACDPPRDPMPVEARIRHSHRPARATVRATGVGGAEVLFDEPQRAITPGQSVVWYRGDLVVGGGIIAR
ncbi:MAG TPA: tRNA 2-thiouridine(34) synthase MnmA [Methylomirabilota bacterium]|nr:tRNA 2-thiouridine(34) synthase MnmA [Methylomirabilota bacterium]